MDESRSVDPTVPYRPPSPKTDLPIALVGCGTITEQHLEAYTDAGFDVVAFCDIDRATAEARRDEYYPDGDVYTDYRSVLEREDVAVVDVATHPSVRVEIIEDAIRAEKHVLSQKPFVLDLRDGRRLVDLAADHDVRLAVNQNGRWAPPLSYLRNAVAAGHIGDVLGVTVSIGWNHDWIDGTPLGDLDHAILYDYAIHWFDLLACVIDDRDPTGVFASTAHSPTQTSTPPLLGQALVEYEGAQATLSFDGNTRYDGRTRIYVTGTEGTIVSDGPSIDEQTVRMTTETGSYSPSLEGTWFPDGFRGSMATLLTAIEEAREPEHSARNNLSSLELCFAAVESAETGEPQRPGDVRLLTTSE